MTCSECWTTIPGGMKKCPRCGAAATGAPPSFAGLLKSYPWLGVLLAMSFFVTVWAATRRAPAPVVVDIPPAVEPEPAPTPEPEAEPAALPMPEVPAPAAEPAAVAAPEMPVFQNPEAGGPAPRPGSVRQPDGSFKADVGALRRP